MKKIVILLCVACALFSFSCNKYCHCKKTIDGVVDKSYKGEFVKESQLDCSAFDTSEKIEGVTYEVKCK